MAPSFNKLDSLLKLVILHSTLVNRLVSRILNEISSFKFKVPNYIETPGENSPSHRKIICKFNHYR